MYRQNEESCKVCIWEGREAEGRQKIKEMGGWKLIVSTATDATKIQLYVDYGYGMSVAVP